MTEFGAAVLALHDCEEEQPDRNGGANDGGNDHADRLDDNPDQVHARRRPGTGVPSPKDPNNEAPHEQSNPDLPALPASEVGGEGARDDKEEAERQQRIVTKFIIGFQTSKPAIE